MTNYFVSRQLTSSSLGRSINVFNFTERALPLLRAKLRLRLDLSRCFRSAQAFVVEARAVEAARAALPTREHRAGIFDPARARLFLLGRGDPLDPISARDRRDVRPQFSRLRSGGCESFSQIRRHLWFRFVRGRCDLQRDNVPRLCARSFAQLPIDFEPVAFLAVRLEHRLKTDAINGAFNRRHAARGKLRTGILWQDEKGPGAGLSALIRPRAGQLHCGTDEFRFETNQGFGHLAGVIDRILFIGWLNFIT